MLIRVADLELRKLDFSEEFQPGAIDFGLEVRQIAPLKTAGRAEIVREHHGGHHIVADIRLIGDLTTRVEVACARCVEPVQEPIEHSFDLLYRPLSSQKGADEVSITEAETEIGYYSGEGMELEDALREQVLLAIPIRVVCREDCKGLCLQCGKNLNESGCDCKPPADPRWNALGNLREKLQ